MTVNNAATRVDTPEQNALFFFISSVSIDEVHDPLFSNVSIACSALFHIVENTVSLGTVHKLAAKA